MRYAVVYQSRSGNTKRVAEEIFAHLSGTDKELWDLDMEPGLPQAGMYFLGFGVRNENCSMDIIDCMESIQGGKFALFATCGLVPSEKYKARLERNLEVWFPDSAEYMGMFLCQGSAGQDWKQKMIERMPEAEDKLERMFSMGEGHPDRADLSRAGEFASALQRKIEGDGNIPIW